MPLPSKIYNTLLLILCVYPTCAKTSDIPNKDLLWLKIAHTYFLVIREGVVDQDSCLMIVSKKGGVSRLPLITEGFGKDYKTSDLSWVDRSDPAVAMKLLNASKGLTRAKFLVLLGAYYAFQPGYRTTDIGQAISHLQAARQESVSIHNEEWLIHALCLLGKTYFKANEPDKALESFAEAIKISQKLANKILEAKAWDYQGTYCPTTPKTIGLKLMSLNKAFELYGAIHDTKNQINCAMNLSYLSFLINDMKEAEKHASIAAAKEKAVNSPVRHYTFDLLSLIYAARGEHGKSMANALAAIKSAEHDHDQFGRGYFYARVGYIFSGGNKYKESLTWAQKALAEFTEKGGESTDIYKVLNLINGLLINLNRPQEGSKLLNSYLKKMPPTTPEATFEMHMALANSDMAVRSFASAERNLLLAQQIAKRSNAVTTLKGAALMDVQLADLYYDWGKFGLAKKYLLLFINNPARITSTSDNTLTAYYRLFKIDSTERNYASALSYHVIYSTLKDSVRSEKQSKLIETLRAEFKAEQSQRDIATLRKENLFEQQRVSQTKKMAFGGLGAAATIILLLLNRYYTNARQKREINSKNEQLEILLKEKDGLLTSKEWLLKEVHHRVKNNLHTVICLLELQASYLKDDALKALEISQHRIYAMSLIHQKLYQSKDLNSVAMSVFIPEFVHYLKESFEIEKKITFKHSIAKIELGIAQAVPLALILNEAVTNSMKYAFTGRKAGTINVSMTANGHQVIMSIADDGIGIDSEDLRSKPNSLGTKLLKGLSEDIGAHLRIENDNGTKVTVVFSTEHYGHLADQKQVEPAEA